MFINVASRAIAGNIKHVKVIIRRIGYKETKTSVEPRMSYISLAIKSRHISRACVQNVCATPTKLRTCRDAPDKVCSINVVSCHTAVQSYCVKRTTTSYTNISLISLDKTPKTSFHAKSAGGKGV